jgi:hypothetical protein
MSTRLSVLEIAIPEALAELRRCISLLWVNVLFPAGSK